ncbi:hypothetical protein [Variovorax sp. PCZ-1]|uniref:hypothetical protein n=1 Tax=Variovorax sp. PCZ-1 TaxID=2835533 RepID=UPI001BCA9603|nr:hypothetical protein [Variovorax sp. PCZ-1]MBS7807652.1 hypothetical protein [Variovorax sp. PCZ-1]
MSDLLLTYFQAWVLFFGIVLCPCIVYAAKALKLLSDRKAEIVIGVYVVAISSAFLALLVYLFYSSGVIPSLPKSSSGKPNMDPSDDLVFRLAVAGVWIWLCGGVFLAGIELIIGKRLFGKSKNEEVEPVSWVRALKGDIKKTPNPNDQSVPWWLVAGVLALTMYAFVQGFIKAGA